MTTLLPAYISIVFILTTLTTVVLFINAIKNTAHISTSKWSTNVTIILVIWLIVQAVLSLTGVYSNQRNIMPPKIMLMGVLPPLVVLVWIFISKSGKLFASSISIKHITYVHIVRVPVEIVLYWLYLHKAIPQIMTFKGYNYDILAGITSIFIAYIAFAKNGVKTTIAIVWNIICLLLLLNIVVIAILSAETPIQQFGLSQPNIAILYFPFSWLPTVIVPLVMFCHIASLKQLLKKMM
jgi:hypothetical protein